MVSASSAQVCSKLQTVGACDDPACSFRHDVFTCDVCCMAYPDKRSFKKHFTQRQHVNRARGASSNFHCPVCEITISGVYNWDNHIQSKQHIKEAADRGLEPGNVEAEDPPLQAGQARCHICNFDMPTEHWERHALTRKHRRREEFANIKSILDNAAKDRNGVAISHAEGGVDMGVVEIEKASAGIQAEVIIQVIDSTAKIKLLGAKLASSSTASRSFSLSNAGSIAAVLKPQVETRLSIIFRQNVLGHYGDRLEVSFEDTIFKQRFIIIRQIKAIVGNQQEYELLKPRTPYVPRTRAPHMPESEVVPGVPPPPLTTVKWRVKLPQAQIPSELATLLSSASVKDILEELNRTILPAVLNLDTYGWYWKNVIWVEEYKMEHDLQIFDIDSAKLRREGRYYYLDVPGLAEKRPSVLIGDRILVHPHGTVEGKWYEGHVHVVRQAEVGLCFHGSFPAPQPQTRHHVRFKLQRIPLRRQHQALDIKFTAERLLFPTTHHIKPAQQIAARIKPFNPLIATNEPQLAAVKAIVNLTPGSMPFILFGPPGTGKTLTTVEAIRQVLTHNPNARILACAPSNSAADLLASRLKTLGKDTIFRFYAPSRAKGTVPTELLDYTYVNPDGHFGLPDVLELKDYRVIVCTCVSASFGYNIGIPRGHFSHIFIDEAGQATEPEVMISLRGMADPQTNVILAGDPKQLGPVIRSAVARRLRLDVSYLERLMQDPMYSEHAGRGVTFMKLTKNYRSHEAILKFPNERFYDGELVPCAANAVMNACIGSSTLVNKKFPVVFHAMSGKDDREASSPSFFNVLEVQQVKTYIEKLRNDKKLKILPKDIGVIAPYRAQCQKIRKVLDSIARRAKDIKVGSVEEFQGQERRVIIISTVRSSHDFVEYDLKHTLGFVANPRRFNVAVTRAQSLLIIIGDPNVLSLDPLWRSFLNYVNLRGGWTGIPIPWDPHEAVREEGGYDAEAQERGAADMNMLADMIRDMALSGVVEEVDEADVNVDQPWREVE